MPKIHYNITLTSVPKSMREAGHVPLMRRGMRIGYWWETQKERDHWEGQDVGGWTILKWILERDRMGSYGLDRSGSGTTGELL
jgi:hypothetical protein